MAPSESTAKSRSTGPRTPEGKQKASHNALRHGLTGRVVVMPWEDMEAYRAFCQELMAGLAPEGPVETQYAQTFCDTQWRLNRARSLEEGMFVLGHREQRDDMDVGHPQANAALIAARAFRDDSKAFLNLSLYEQRLQRTLKESLRQLRELQAARRIEKEAEPAKETEAEAEAPPPAVEEFVFSTTRTPAETGPAQQDPATRVASESHHFPATRAA